MTTDGYLIFLRVFISIYGIMYIYHKQGSIHREKIKLKASSNISDIAFSLLLEIPEYSDSLTIIWVWEECHRVRTLLANTIKVSDLQYWIGGSLEVLTIYLMYAKVYTSVTSSQSTAVLIYTPYYMWSQVFY